MKRQTYSPGRRRARLSQSARYQGDPKDANYGIAFAKIVSRGRTYIAYTEREAYYIRDTVGGDIEWL